MERHNKQWWNFPSGCVLKTLFLSLDSCVNNFRSNNCPNHANYQTRTICHRRDNRTVAIGRDETRKLMFNNIARCGDHRI